MDRIRIVGGSPLNGTLPSRAAKECLASPDDAGLLTEETLVLDNVRGLRCSQLHRNLGNHGVDIISAGKRSRATASIKARPAHISFGRIDIIDTQHPYLVSRMRRQFSV